MIVLLRALCLFAVRVFYRTIALGGIERLPEQGPCIVVANHPNGLLDPVVTRIALGRRLAFLAKSTLFGNPAGRAATKAFDAIPVYRHKDKADTSQNERTFQLCRDLLAKGGWLMLFPEGTSHSDPSMKPFKTGAARIALSAEAAHDFNLGLRILPVGLLYEDKESFRTRAAVSVGVPLSLKGYAERYKQDERATVEALTQAIDEAVSAVVLQADNDELWNGFLAVAAWTSADGGKDLAAREARARELARAFHQLSQEEPERAASLVEKARRYVQVLRAVGIADPFALEQSPFPGVGAMVRFVAPLILLTPLALLGTIVSYPPYRLIAVVVGRMKKLESDVTSSVKVIAGLVFFTSWYGLLAVVAGALWGWPAGLGTFAVAPALGYIALRYWERVTLRREALRAWWLRFNRQSLTDAVQQRRKELCTLVERELAGTRPADESA
jgi:glycerol-3-phosphate O-acyltransferase/dihydroxyacetone phosphate acyltransferase